jgi:hypothetical protein
MSSYHEDTSRQTTRSPTLVQPASQPDAPWEWAQLTSTLSPGGYATAALYSFTFADDGSLTYALGQQTLTVYDFLLTSTSSLGIGQIVRIVKHGSGRWFICEWKCGN